MDHLQQAIHCLENIPAIVWKGNIIVEEAITHLCSAARLLESPTVSTDKLMSASESLRRRLLPLYCGPDSLVSPSLDYTTSVLLFLYRKGIPAMPNNAGNQPSAWETVIVSILSSLLDFLDENTNKKIRECIANALYPIVCPAHFLTASRKTICFHAELSSVVYQTLTASVDSHTGNVTKLRDQIDRKGMGLTISQTKDFLALESLLDLFGSLIPSKKGGRAKRSAFINGVFDLVIFDNTGRHIQKLLEDISSPDWSLTSHKIVKALAEHDISFPQPFEASTVKLNETPLGFSAPFYIDRSRFIANIDKAGEIETLSVPYATVSNISFESLNNLVHVTLRLTKPPVLGSKPIAVPLNDNILFSWDISKACFSSLLKALKSRRLPTGKTGNDKLSKGEPIKLDFDSAKRDPHILAQERLQQLSQSWALVSPKSKSESGIQLQTSPLVPHLPQISAKAVEGIDNPPKSAVPLSSAPSDSNGNLRPAPNIKLATKNPTENALGPGSDHAHSDQIDIAEANRITPNALPRKKQLIVLSDDDEPKPLKSGDQDKTRLRKKRPIVDIELDESELDTKEEPPLKRGRHEPSSPSPVRPSKIKKYTRKGPPSSPAAPASPLIDFDTIPNSTIKKARASEMKGKNVKSVSKVKPERKQIPAEKKYSDVSGKVRKEIKDVLPKPADIDDTPKVRRSARFSKTESPVKERKESPVKEISVPKLHKARNAPWEDPNFSEQSKVSSDPIVLQPDSDDHLITEGLHPEAEFRGDVPSFDAAEIFQASPQRQYSLPQAEIVQVEPKAVTNDDATLHKRVVIDLTDTKSPLPVPKTNKYDIKPKPIVPPKKGTEKDIPREQAKESSHTAKTAPTVRLDHERPIERSSVKMTLVKEAGPPLLVNASPLLRVDNVKQRSALHKIDRSTPVREGNNRRLSVDFALPRPETPRKISIPHPKNFQSDSTGWDHSRRRDSPLGFNSRSKQASYAKSKEDPMKQIIAVVQQINKAVVYNIEHRFEKVTENLNIGQRKMLEDTANGLHDMYQDSVQYFNDMMDLEEKYSSCCNELDAGTHDYIKSSEQLAQCFKDVSVNHIRQSLSKTFPTSLFPKAFAMKSHFEL